MQINDLSRGQRFALMLFLTAAILLPLFILAPRYVAWQADEKQQEFNADVSDANPVVPAGI